MVSLKSTEQGLIAVKHQRNLVHRANDISSQHHQSSSCSDFPVKTETLQSGICHQTRIQPGNQSLVIMRRPFSPRCAGSGSATQRPPGSSGWWECGPRCSGESEKLPGWRHLSRRAGGFLEDLSWPSPLETNESCIFNTNRFIFVSREEHNKCFMMCTADLDNEVPFFEGGE